MKKLLTLAAAALFFAASCTQTKDIVIIGGGVMSCLMAFEVHSWTPALVGLVLIIIGAINWAFVGLFNIDLVASLFGGTDNIIAKIIYIIIGIAGLIDISYLFEQK